MGNKCSSPAPVKPARVHNNHGTLPDEKAAAVEFTVTKGGYAATKADNTATTEDASATKHCAEVKAGGNETTIAVESEATNTSPAEQHVLEGSMADGQRYQYVEDLFSVYNMTEAIGRGLDAIVFRAVPVNVIRNEPQSVAVKVLQKSRLLSMEARKLSKLRNELSIWQNLSHPSIIHLYRVVEVQEACCLVCELAKMELFDALQQVEALSEHECKLVMAQITSGLSYLHLRHHVVHRDIKSANILCMHERLTEAGCIKLADLGFAVRVSDHSACELEDNCGTLEYYAPELCENMLARITREDTIYYSTAVDCWALGCVMYECIAGEPPFWADDDVIQVHLILRSCLEFPKDVFGTISDEAIALMTGLLCPDPKKRLTLQDCLQHPWYLSEDRSSDLNAPSALDTIGESESVTPVEQRLFPKLQSSPAAGRRTATNARRASNEYMNTFRRKNRASIVEGLNVSQFVQEMHSESLQKQIEGMQQHERKAKAGYIRDTRRRRASSESTSAIDRSSDIQDVDLSSTPDDHDWRGPFGRRKSDQLVEDITKAFESLNRMSAMATTADQK